MRYLTTTAVSIGMVLCAACGDDASLRIHLDIPTAYQELVTTVSVAIVVPSAVLGDAPFSCDDIAFDAIDSELVRANTVEELLLPEQGSGSLDAIPRDGDKLLLVKGYNSAGEQLIAGCGAHGDIRGAETMDISGEPITISSIPVLSANDVPGRKTSVRITDVLGVPASGIEVQWTQTAPGSSASVESATTDVDGYIEIESTPPLFPGPVAVDVRAKWARTSPPALVGFRNPPSWFTGSLPNAENEPRNPTPNYVAGRLGPEGEMGFAALSNGDDSNARQVSLVYYNTDTSQFVSVLSPQLPPSVLHLSLITGKDRDRAITTSLTELIEIRPNGTLQSLALAPPIQLVRRAFSIANCSVTPVDPQPNGPLLLLSFGNGSRGAINAVGNTVSSLFVQNDISGTPVASGCLSFEGDLHRAVVYSDGEVVTLLVAFDGLPRTVTLGIVQTGIGFTTGALDGQAQLLATTLSISGTDLARFTILPVGDDALDVELTTSDATPTFAQSIDAGDFDADGKLDIAALMSFGDANDEPVYRLYIALGLQSLSGRVVGMSSQFRGTRPSLFVRDFDGDGHDDILVGTTASFQVFSMGALQ